jgi:uracil-DNA glycosylase
MYRCAHYVILTKTEGRSRHTPLDNVKVVVVGQDPYHNHGQAHGLCFSVRPPTPAPPSLVNIFAACEKDVPGFKRPPNKGGLLTPWADQGVLLLNTVLTVRAHEANSHQKKGWEKFTQKVIDTVAKVRQRGVVFLAWGKPAQQRVEGIKGSKHLVLRGIHPSPLAARAGNFSECGHFKKTNEWLRERYTVEGEIDWDLAANKQKPIKGPNTEQAAKITEDQQEKPQADGPVTELAEKNGDKTIRADEFEDDLDAIEALEELANSSQVDGGNSDTKSDAVH